MKKVNQDLENGKLKLEEIIRNVSSCP